MGDLPTAPKVSVVIPAYNAGELIEGALASVAAQTFADLEVIVVDDCSTDDTVARAEAALRGHGRAHQVVRMSANGGPSAARNLGVRLARGEYVAFLDSDDEWLPGKIAAQVKLLDANPQVTLCGCQALWIEEGNGVVGPLFEDLPDMVPDGWKILLWNCFIATPCAMVRRDDLGTAPFDLALRIGEDRDLWIRLASNGRVALVQDVMVRIRIYRGSFSYRNRDLILTCTRPMIQKHLHWFARDLGYRDHMLVHGGINTLIGKSLCWNPSSYFEGARYLLSAIALGFRPVDNLRELLYRAPILRDIKAFVKRRYFAP